MQRKFLLVFLVLLSAVFGYTETLTLYVNGAIPKNVLPADAVILQSSVMANLQDMNDILNNVYIRPDTLEQWINMKINDINSTNTNVLIVNKKTVQAKKIAAVSLKTINTTVLKSIASYVKIDQVLNISYSSNGGNLLVAFTLQNGSGAAAGSATAAISASRLQETSYVNTVIKEALVSLNNLWPRYYYMPRKTGILNVSATPKEAVMVIKSLGKKIISGKNEGIPFGTYTVMVTASNYTTLITNVNVTDKTPSYNFKLNKINVKSGIVSTGNLMLDSDFPEAAFVIIADDMSMSAKTPYLFTNLTAGDIKIVFDETPEYSLKTVMVTVKSNDNSFEFIKLDRKGSSLKITCNVDGASVILDRDIVGVISNKVFEISSTSGIHALSLLKDRYNVLRTNIILKPETGETIQADLTPKKVSGLIVTPQAAKADVVKDGKKIGITPYYANFDPANPIDFQIVATNLALSNQNVSTSWQWNSDNNLLVKLTPLFGDIRVKTIPEDALVTIEGIQRGKTIAEGIAVFQLPAKIVKVRIEKPGYKTVNTNFSIAPNLENLLSLTMIEAPAKAFITTAPEKGFEIYINNEFAGISGAGVIPMEYGKWSLKLKKNGFKTIITNIEVSTKDPVISYASTPGIGENEFLDKLDQARQLFFKLIEDGALASAVSNLNAARTSIQASELKVLPSVGEYASKFEKLSSIMDTHATAEEKNSRDGADADQAYQRSITLIEGLEQDEAQSFNDIKRNSLNQLENLQRKKADRDQSVESRRLIQDFSPVVSDGDALIRNEKYSQAVDRYNDALKIIDESDLKDNPKIKEYRLKIEKKIKNNTARAQEDEVWWPKMVRNWYGVSISAGGAAGMTPNGIAIPLYGRLGVSLLQPILNLDVGYMYNLGIPNPSMGPLIGGTLRIPVTRNIAVFGLGDIVIADFSKFTQYFDVNAGVDVKFDGIGFKLFYELEMSAQFSKMAHGVGAAVTIWLTQE